MQREREEQEHADVEVGQREAGQREQASDDVRRAIAPYRRPGAEWNADDDADQGRGQREFDRVGQAVEQQGVDRRAVGHRHAEVAGEGMADERQVLHPERLIEAQLLAECRDGFRRGIFAECGDGRIAWQDAQGEEDQRQDQQDRRDDLQATAKDVAGHQRITAARSPAPA